MQTGLSKRTEKTRCFHRTTGVQAARMLCRAAFVLLVGWGLLCVTPAGVFADDNLSLFRKPGDKASGTASRQVAEPRNDVRYTPIAEARAETATVDGNGTEPVQVPGPAEKAAERAKAYRLSQSIEEGAARGGIATPSRIESDTEVGDPTPVHLDHPLTYDECVHLALKQSPYFVKSAMEIQLKRIDESDSWYKLLPNLLVSTGYVMNMPKTADSRFSLSFTTGGYDPIAAGFSIEATKLLTEITILGHMMTISKGIYELGQMFMQLGSFDQMLVIQNELAALARHEKAYLTNLLATGGSNPLEVRIAEQQVELSELERDRLMALRTEMMADLKQFLGLDSATNLELDFRDYPQQVIGSFMPDQVTVENVVANSMELKIEKQKREIQEYEVMLAWSRFLPKLYFQSRTADPIDSLDNTDRSNRLYTSVGFTWTVWDWGERTRNIRRQRVKVRKQMVEENLLAMDVRSDWSAGLSAKRRTLAALKVARSQVELAGLRKRQSEISYQSGMQPFPVYLEQIREYFLARQNALSKELDDDGSLLELRYMSGNLFNTYINASDY